MSSVEQDGGSLSRCAQAGSRPQLLLRWLYRLLPAEPAQFDSVEDGDPLATERDEAPVCKLPESLGCGLPGGGSQGGELLVGQSDLYSAAKRPARPGCGERNECASNPLRHRLEDGVAEPLFELAKAAAQSLRDARCDAGVAEQEASHVGLGHDADDDLVKGLSEAVVHPLTDDDHLAEDG